jgi:hypothetical protein
VYPSTATHAASLEVISALGIDPGLITGKAEITRQPRTADKAFAIHIAIRHADIPPDRDLLGFPKERNS